MTFLYLALVIQFDKSVHFSFQPLSLLSLRVQSQSQVVTFFSQMFIRRLVKTVIQVVLRVFFAQKWQKSVTAGYFPFISGGSNTLASRKTECFRTLSTVVTACCCGSNVRFGSGMSYLFNSFVGYFYGRLGRSILLRWGIFIL